MKEYTDKEIEKIKTDSWREGFTARTKAFERQNTKEIKIGKAILDVLYDTFETHKEDY
jgi:hypothetical protein